MTACSHPLKVRAHGVTRCAWCEEILSGDTSLAEALALLPSTRKASPC